MQEALEEVIQFYKDNDIEIKTPIKIQKSEERIYALMELSYKTRNRYIENEEILDKEWAYRGLTKFLHINPPNKKIRELIKKNIIHSDTQPEESPAILIYDNELEELLSKNENPEKKLKTIFTHELWHIIEHEEQSKYDLISEGTATYAMYVYAQDTSMLDNIIDKKILYTTWHLKYEYAAAIVKKHLNGSTNLKKMLDNNIRREINEDYKQKTSALFDNVLRNEMFNNPLIFLTCINELFEQTQNSHPTKLSESIIFDSLNRREQQRVIEIYTFIQKKIDKMK